MATKSNLKNERAVAAQILAQVIGTHTSLKKALLINRSVQEKMADGSVNEAKNKAFIQELCYGTVRHWYGLEFVLQKLLSKPLKKKDNDIHCLLMLGLYQLQYMRVPDHAAVTETVNASRQLKKVWAKGLINAVMRNFGREKETLLSNIENNVQAHYQHPTWLIKAWQQAWPDYWQEILQANNQKPPMVLRVNQQQNSREEYLSLLRNNSLEAEPLPHNLLGICLQSPCVVEKLPGFRQGRVSVQDGAAQIAADLLDVQPGQRVLDACAAPGGKTAHILELQPDLAELVAIDNDESRVLRIKGNLQRLKLNATVKLADATQPEQWWNEQLFDRILLDVPCSSTGVIRRNPDIKILRQPEHIEQLVKLQADILSKLWPLLRPGGRLLYATCSIFPEENEKQVKAFLEKETLGQSSDVKLAKKQQNFRNDAKLLEIVAEWGHNLEVGRQILPHTGAMDGFYYALIEKC